MTAFLHQLNDRRVDEKWETKIENYPKFFTNIDTGMMNITKEYLLIMKYTLLQVRKFNDPFDSIIPIRFEEGTDEQYLERTRRVAKQFNNLFSDVEIRQAIERLKDPSFSRQFNEKMRKSIYNDFGIFSLSKSKDNILLWSHYSNSHQGFSVGLNVEKFRLFLDQYCLEHPDLKYCLKEISYCKDIPILNPHGSEEQRNNITLQLLTTKSQDWHYEKEYRVIIYFATGRTIKIPRKIITEVILGCNISKKDSTEIQNILKDYPTQVSLFKANKKYERYGLDFEKIF